MRAFSTLILLVLLATTPAVGQVAVSEDSTSTDEVRNLVDLGLSGRDTWYVRGFDSLFARTDPAEGEAARDESVRLDEAFAPYAGLRIRTVWIVGREAFGTIVDDSTSAEAVAGGDTVVTRTSPFTGFLNVIATQTWSRVVRSHLRFAEGDVIDPFKLADSERLLRAQDYISDTRIEVIPLPDRPGWADVAVLVRDRFPWESRATSIPQTATTPRSSTGISPDSASTSNTRSPTRGARNRPRATGSRCRRATSSGRSSRSWPRSITTGGSSGGNSPSTASGCTRTFVCWEDIPGGKPGTRTTSGSPRSSTSTPSPRTPGSAGRSGRGPMSRTNVGGAWFPRYVSFVRIPSPPPPVRRR